MARIKIHFWRGGGVIGTAIRWFTHGRFSHVGMEIDGTLFEAREFRGVVSSRQIVAEIERPPTETLFIDVSESQLERARQWWRARIGLPYDYLSVIRFVTRRDETCDTKPKYFCSEAVFDVCKFIGVELFSRVDGSRVSPSWIYRSSVLKREKNDA